MKTKDLTGLKFNKLTVIEKATANKYSQARWRCKCDCGNESIVVTQKLTSGRTKTCGCSKLISPNKTHGLSGIPEYRIWDGIIQRATNPKCSTYDRYGGRGIGVCDRWRKFENFLEDMGRRPKDYTIERIDNDKGYSLDNCKWDTRVNQARNRRSSRFIIIDGVTRVLSEWLIYLNLSGSTFHRRRKRGLSERDSLGL